MTGLALGWGRHLPRWDHEVHLKHAAFCRRDENSVGMQVWLRDVVAMALVAQWGFRADWHTAASLLVASNVTKSQRLETTTPQRIAPRNIPSSSHNRARPCPLHHPTDWIPTSVCRVGANKAAEPSMQIVAWRNPHY
jgi:hypothetical protein